MRGNAEDEARFLSVAAAASKFYSKKLLQANGENRQAIAAGLDRVRRPVAIRAPMWYSRKLGGCLMLLPFDHPEEAFQ
jgi:hypothetical protein